MVNENLRDLEFAPEEWRHFEDSNGYRITNDLARYLRGTEDP